jgi:hypothetical protein
MNPKKRDTVETDQRVSIKRIKREGRIENACLQLVMCVKAIL